jgi:hypothetical protein
MRVGRCATVTACSCPRSPRADAEFDVTVYKLGDKYVAARGREFGHANYAIEEIR